MLITFEGVDGSGKTTQSRKLYNFLRERGVEAYLYREPGGTPVGESIREIVINQDVYERTELLLFESARAELVQRELKPKLERGAVLILDRYTDSTLAYQSYGRGIDIDLVLELNRFASQGIKPDITFLLDLEPAEALRRVKNSTRFDELEFLKRVREGFLKIAEEEPQRVVVLSSSEGEEEVFSQILGRLKGKFPDRFDF